MNIDAALKCRAGHFRAENLRAKLTRVNYFPLNTIAAAYLNPLVYDSKRTVVEA
jgi:hypothetical protein